MNSVIFDGSRFMAVGSDIILTSADGFTWESRDGVDGYYLNSVVKGKNSDNMDLYVAVGDNGYPGGYQGLILTSSNGNTWSSQTLYTANPNITGVLADSNTTLRGVAMGNGVIVAVGYNGDGTGTHGAILTSVDDGLTWTSQTDNAWGYLYSVAYGNGLFVAVGINGIILTSPDGVNWTVQPASGSLFTDTLNGISYIEGEFIATGHGGKIWTSTDGVTWSKEFYTSVPLNGIAYGDGLYVTVGDSGKVLGAATLPFWEWRGYHYRCGGSARCCRNSKR